MGTIEVNAISAHNQATKICQASDKLTISTAVTFSEDTTISGNTNAKSTFESMKKGAAMAQKLLNRDVQAIQSVISTFTRTDQQMKGMIEELPMQHYVPGVRNE